MAIKVRKYLTVSRTYLYTVIFIEPPAKPLFVSNTLESITIRWDSQSSVSSITYIVQLQISTQSPWMDANCGAQSLLPNQCVIRGSVAHVTGLKQNTVYRFRVYAMFKSVRSDVSLSSDPLRTRAGDVEFIDNFSCWRCSGASDNGWA